MTAEELINFVFPPRCGGCGRRGSWFCNSCRAQAQSALAQACADCGRISVLDPCPTCAGPGGLDSLAAWFVLDGPLRAAVHRLKYGGRPRIAGALVDLGLERGQDIALGSALPMPGVIVAVPLGDARRRERGYNQSEALARRLAERTGRERGDGLRRRRETVAQVGRTGSERRASMHGAFAWVGAAPPEVLLIDDVVTTGATLHDCARAAREAGAERVNALALALG